MGTSIVDGTVETATITRKRKNIAIISPLTFRLNDGGSRTIKRAIVSGLVADLVQPGSSGRFYLSTTMDLKGVHGARTAQGTAYDFPGRNNKIVFMVVVIVNILWMALRIATDGGLPLLGVALMTLGAVGFFLTQKAQKESKAQFDNDQPQT